MLHHEELEQAFKYWVALPFGATRELDRVMSHVVCDKAQNRSPHGCFVSGIVGIQ